MLHKTKDFRPLLEPIIKGAGAILMDHFHRALTIKLKEGGHQGAVTQADTESEAFLIKNLLPIIPGAAIIAEESGARGANEYCWVIDPLDGTTNFIHGLPLFCISIALTYHDEPVVGAIYSPLLQEFFYAQEGMGAMLNGNPIQVSNPAAQDGMLLIGLPTAKNHWSAVIVDAVQKRDLATVALRQIGSVAMSLAYTACGRFDGHYFTDCFWWDIAAGVLLVEEAGGTVTDFEGRDIEQNQCSVMVGGPQVYTLMQELLQTTKV